LINVGRSVVPEGGAMCLGEVARVRDVTAPGTLAIEIDGRTTTVSGMLLDVLPTTGDWVLVHSGFAIGQLTEAEAREALDIRRAGREAL
jgi:hydrogenase assembly chaperone HypC/HupF